MSVSTQVSGNIVKILVDGNFDIGCYEAFNQAVVQNINSAEKFVVDLAQTTYMDSSALGMLLLLREKTGGDTSKVEFTNVNDEVMKILQVAKFDQLFTIS